MFQSTSDVLEKRLLVEGAMYRLQTMIEYSPIAVRGVQLIGSLLAEELVRRVGSSSNGRKRSARDANMPDVDSLAKRMSTTSAATSSDLGLTSLGLSPGASMSAVPAVNRASSSIMADDNSTGLLGGSSLLQDSQDALDWLFINPMEASWGGGDGGESDPTFFSNGESTVDFWRLLEGHGQNSESGLHMM